MRDELTGTTVKVFKSHIRYGKNQCGNFSMYIRKLIDQDIIRNQNLKAVEETPAKEVEIKTEEIKEEKKKEPLKWFFPKG